MQSASKAVPAAFARQSETLLGVRKRPAYTLPADVLSLVFDHLDSLDLRQAQGAFSRLARVSSERSTIVTGVQMVEYWSLQRDSTRRSTVACIESWMGTMSSTIGCSRRSVRRALWEGWSRQPLSSLKQSSKIQLRQPTREWDACTRP